METLSVAFESCVLRYMEMSTDSREVLLSTRSYWDGLTNTGARDGNSGSLALSQMCKNYVRKNMNYFKTSVRWREVSSSLLAFTADSHTFLRRTFDESCRSSC